MPICKNDPKRKYIGNEPSPKGLGWCAHGEKEGSIRIGLDKNKWIVKKVSNGSLRWFKTIKDIEKKQTLINLNYNNDPFNNSNIRIHFRDLPFFNIILSPYLFRDDPYFKIYKFGNNKLTKYIIDNKLSLMKKIVTNILTNDFNIKKYFFNKKTNLIELKISVNHIRAGAGTRLYPTEKYNINFLKNIITENFIMHFGNNNTLVGNLAADGWMEGDTFIIKENEYNNKDYQLGINFKKIIW